LPTGAFVHFTLAPRYAGKQETHPVEADETDRFIASLNLPYINV